MKFFVVFSLFLLSQTVFSWGSRSSLLTHQTKHLLKTGKLFKLEMPVDNITRTVALREINEQFFDQLSRYIMPKRVKEAEKIVSSEHGREGLILLGRVLMLQRVADTLEVDLDFEYFKKLDADTLEDLDESGRTWLMGKYTRIHEHFIRYLEETDQELPPFLQNYP